MQVSRRDLLVRAAASVERNQSCAAFVDSVTDGVRIDVETELRIASVWHSAMHAERMKRAESALPGKGQVDG